MSGEQDRDVSTSAAPKSTSSSSDALFEEVNLNQLSENEQIELAQFGQFIDMRGGFTALSASQFERAKQLITKGRGEDVTPRA